MVYQQQKERGGVGENDNKGERQSNLNNNEIISFIVSLGTRGGCEIVILFILV